MAFLPGLTQLLTGKIASGDDDSAAQKYLQQQTGAFNGIAAPTFDPVTLAQQQWQGDVTPQDVSARPDISFGDVKPTLTSAVAQGDSAMNNVSTDPRLADAQLAALGGLQQIAQGGGMTAADKANLNQIQDQSAQADAGRRNAILQNMSERGMGGSGAEELAQLTSSQAATDQQNQAGLNIAGQAQARALQALTGAGSMAEGMQGQQFNQLAEKARAQDVINRFNAANSTSANQFNAGAQTQGAEYNAGNDYNAAAGNRAYGTGVDQYNSGTNNQAAYYNAGGRQGVSNSDVGTQNANTMYNQNQAPQQSFQDKMGLGAAKSGAAAAGANYYNGQSQGDRQGFTNFTQGAIEGGTNGAANSHQYGSVMGPGQGQNANGSWASGFGPEDAMAFAHGGLIPGSAPVPGDSPLNDNRTIKASPGEMMLPRSVVATHNPAAAAHFFASHMPAAGGPATAPHPAIGPTGLGNFLAKLPKPGAKANPASNAARSQDYEQSALKQLLAKFSSGEVS